MPTNDRPFPRARKRFGQHYLEAPWVARLLEVLQPASDDVFIEIGPGRGALTRALAPLVRELIAVEIDRDLTTALAGRLPPHVRLIEGDILEIAFDDLTRHHSAPLRVVGNLPYNISSPILFRLLAAADEGRRLRDATVMLQKEVADRLVARPGTKAYGTLAVQTQLLADVDRLLTLPPGAFRPPPRVTSSVVRLNFRPPAADVGTRQAFEQLVRGIFLHRRKTVLNALRPIAGAFGVPAEQVLERAQITSSRRPETLTLEEIARLSRAVL